MGQILAWSYMPMTPEQQICACANTLIEQHGNEAWYHAAIRADALLAEGNLDGHAMYKAILARIADLLGMEPVGSVH